MFINFRDTENCTWQAFERLINRVLIVKKFDDPRIVGESNDHGADLIANKFDRRWLFQVKHWKNSVGTAVVNETMKASTVYDAQNPVIVSLNGFDSKAKELQQNFMKNSIPLQLWDVPFLINYLNDIKDTDIPNDKKPREYQEKAIQKIVNAYITNQNRALVVLATGLGKTFVAAETVRRISLIKKNKVRVLVMAHTNPLVYQLEKAFWKFMNINQRSIVWNGEESPQMWQLEQYEFVFACIDSVSEYINKELELSRFDIVIVDECHHAGSPTYQKVLKSMNAGMSGGPFLIGVTATPWRPDEINIEDTFGDPVVSVDMIEGLNNGYLANVDYRMYTDNIDWNKLKDLKGDRFSPKQINRTLFIEEWDDSVVYELKKTCEEINNPRVIVFCGTIEHAQIMSQKINAMGFCKAAAIYSKRANGDGMNQFERNRVLCDFSIGKVNVICTVDMLNEGIDVPDVNLIVFQRVTHSRRIFIQQLGRGLRISDTKEKVIVLDFVSDIRRFAAGLELKDGVSHPDKPMRISINNKVSFKKVNGEDEETEKFLRVWLDDVVAIEEMGENSSELKFPPIFPDSKR